MLKHEKSDLAILNDLERFRVLRRDDLIEIHFSHLKQPVTACNTVMKRLRRDGYVEANADNHQYLYFLSPSPIKKDSVKIPHFLKIVEFYKLLLKYEPPKTFVVEPKYGEKGKYMELDIFMLWKKGAFFVEVQRSVYSDRVMNEKVRRYEDYHIFQTYGRMKRGSHKQKDFSTCDHHYRYTIPLKKSLCSILSSFQRFGAC